MTRQGVEAVVAIIRGWGGKLTWPSLVIAIEEQTGATYTRQALHNHGPIRNAFHTRKGSPQSATGIPAKQAVSPILRAAYERLERVERENRELKNQEAQFLEQFARWSYNAAIRGLTEKALNRPLPPVSRNGKT